MQLTKKTGRKQKHFIGSNGKPVVGLTRRPDGRWRVIGTHHTFREDDELKAIEKFHKLKDANERPYFDTGTISYKNSAIWAITNGFTFLNFPDAEERFWRYVASEIQARPQYVAQMTGIERIGYLDDLNPPAALPTFKELELEWETHSTAGRQTKRKVLAAWRDFAKTAGVRGLKDITPQVCIVFKDAVTKRNLGGKSEQHMFNGCRRLLRFAQERAIAVDEIAKALTAMRLLVTHKETVSLDPRPISREDFHKLLDAAEGDNKAMLLLCLNCGLYLEEAVSMRWENIKDDKYLVAHRKKKGSVLRIACLWPETIKALASITRHEPTSHIFYGYQQTPLTVSGAGKRFRKIRTLSKISANVTSNNLRDGALTAISESVTDEGVGQMLCNLLSGHRSGIKDHYAKRNPETVRPATNAIYRRYMATVL